MYREKHYDYSGTEGKRIKGELKKRGFHHATISNFPADFFRMSKSQLEKLFEHASDAFISRMYDVPERQIKNRRDDFGIKQLMNTLNRMEREDKTAQLFKEILRIVSNEYNNGNIPHTNSTPLNSEKEFFTREAWQGSRAPIQNLRFCKWVRFFRREAWQGSRAPIQNL